MGFLWIASPVIINAKAVWMMLNATVAMQLNFGIDKVWVVVV